MTLHRIVLTAFAFAAAAGAAPYCTEAGLRGSFAFTARGTTLAALGLPAALTGAFSSSGFADFDGQGHFSLTASSSFAGAVQGPATVTGTYEVNRDCSYTSRGNNGATFRGAIVSSGSELLILQTNNGTAITGTAQARGGLERDNDNHEDGRRAQRCTPASLAGSYGFLADGFAGAPTIPGAPFAPLAGVGTFVLNPNGTFRMTAQRSVNGTLDPQPLPLAERFTMGPNCTLKMDFDVGFHFNGTVVDGDTIVYIEADPGTAVTVNAKRM